MNFTTISRMDLNYIGKNDLGNYASTSNFKDKYILKNKEYLPYIKILSVMLNEEKKEHPVIQQAFSAKRKKA